MMRPLRESFGSDAPKGPVGTGGTEANPEDSLDIECDSPDPAATAVFRPLYWLEEADWIARMAAI